MDFRRTLVSLSGLTDFDSSTAAGKMGVKLGECSLNLMRLYRMGFLRRKVAKRTCTNRDGRRCSRGRRYIYNFTRKGVTYLTWLQRVKPLLDINWYRRIQNIRSNLPKDDPRLLRLTKIGNRDRLEVTRLLEVMEDLSERYKTQSLEKEFLEFELIQARKVPEIIMTELERNVNACVQNLHNIMVSIDNMKVKHKSEVTTLGMACLVLLVTLVKIRDDLFIRQSYLYQQIEKALAFCRDIFNYNG